jgi:hypothetical protein
VASFGTLPTKATSSSMIQTPITPSSTINMEFSHNAITKKEEKPSTANFTPPATPLGDKYKSQEKEQSSKPKSYRDAIGKKEKVTTTTTNEIQPTTTAAAATPAPVATEIKATKSGKQKAPKSGGRNTKATRGHPQDVNDYYDESWYYGTGEEGYLHTGYIDDQEVFVGNLSAQVSEADVKIKIIIIKYFILINYFYLDSSIISTIRSSSSCSYW